MAFTDCEVRDSWFFQQDLNAWSSLAYLVAAALVAWKVHGRTWPPAFSVLALLLALEGAGSIAYHGATIDAGEALHDVALVGIVGFLAGWHVRIGEASRTAAIGGLGVFAVGGMLWWPLPGSVEVLVVVGAATIVVSVARDRRRGLPAVADGRLVALIAIALAAWTAGTPASPLCDPDTIVQPHALWHVLSAAAIVLWAARAKASTGYPTSCDSASTATVTARTSGVSKGFITSTP